MRILLISLAGIGLVACTQTQNASRAPESPQSLMVRVAKQVQACWFKQRDPALNGLRVSSEINSFAGKPRILLVPRSNPEGLPKLVAQAEKSGGRTQFTSFGPLLASDSGPRLQASLNRWAYGSTKC